MILAQVRTHNMLSSGSAGRSVAGTESQPHLLTYLAWSTEAPRTPLSDLTARVSEPHSDEPACVLGPVVHFHN